MACRRFQMAIAMTGSCESIPPPPVFTVQAYVYFVLATIHIMYICICIYVRCAFCSWKAVRCFAASSLNCYTAAGSM